MELSKQICLTLGIDPKLQLKKAIRGLPGFTSEQLVLSLISTDSVQKAAKLLGYTLNPVKVSIREYLSPKFKNRSKSFDTGGKVACWRFTLLAQIEQKHCTSCNRILAYSDYSNDNSKSDGLSQYCKTCSTNKSKLHKFYIVERTPQWSELELIAEFYNNCPKDYHVDHIVPLRGKNVCGLHVLSNLQYLPATENLKKSNNF